MTERLNNNEITRRIMDANSDLRRYLNLAPSLKPTPANTQTVKHYPQQIPPNQLAKVKNTP